MPADRQEPQTSVTLAELAAQNHQELSAAMQKCLKASVYGGSILRYKTLWGVSPHPFPPHTPTPMSSQDPS